MNELQTQLLDYCEAHNIKPYRIAKHRDTTPNPFPIGTRTVYELARGKPISWSAQLKMKHFFNELEKLENNERTERANNKPKNKT